MHLRPRTIAVLLGIAVLSLDLALRNRNYQVDALTYALDIEDPSRPDFFHPHHVLFTPLAWLAVRVVQWFDPAARAIGPAQILVACGGAAGVAVFYGFLHRTLRRGTLYPLLGAILLALCYGYWHYSTELESYVLPVAPLLLSALSLHGPDAQPTPARAARAAAWHALAIGFHQIHVLFTVVLLGLILTTEGLGRRERFRLAAAYAATLALAAGGIYLGIALLTGHGGSPRELFQWSTSYAHAGRWGAFHWANLYFGGGGALTAVMAKGLIQRILSEPSWTAATVGGVALTAIAGAGITALLAVWLGNARVLIGERGFLFRLALVWPAAYIPFLLWWEPYNPEHWISLLVPLCIATASLVSSDAPVRGFPRALRRATFPVLLFTIGTVNLFSEILPESRWKNNEYYAFSAQAVRHVRSADLLLVPMPQVNVYGEYFFGHPFRRLALHDLPAGSPDPPANCDFIQREIGATLHHGHRVFVAEHEFEVGRASPKQLRHLSPADYAACYGPYRSRLAPVFRYCWLGKRYTLFEVKPGPAEP